MISLSLIQELLVENRREVELSPLIERQLDFDFNDAARTVLVGIRRSGKSSILYLWMQQLLAKGYSWNDMLYFNFEDERILEFEASDFNRILEAHSALCGSEAANRKPVLFLDEIQNIKGWEHFARRLADQNYRVHITGSNAKMLSGEIATTLGGRYLTIEISPFSFDEYLDFRVIPHKAADILTTQARALLRSEFDEYLHLGGFPEVIGSRLKRRFLQSIYEKIYLGDIINRNEIPNAFALRLLMQKTAESVGQPLTFSRLAKILEAAGTKITYQTVKKYMDYAKEAFLLKSVVNYTAKLAESATKSKYYFSDVGFLEILVRDPLSKQLENLVALSLLRKYGTEASVYYYQYGSVDVDFYVEPVKTAIQVTTRMSDSPATRQREIGALVKLSKYLHCERRLVLTIDEEGFENTDEGRIEILPVWKWLLTESVLPQ